MAMGTRLLVSRIRLEGAAAISFWRKGNFGRRLSLSGVNLAGVNLAGAVLTGANLSGTDLTGAAVQD
ncbi:MAG: pentapeptide repeat-containing protein [Planctomycetota bacterium]